MNRLLILLAAGVVAAARIPTTPPAALRLRSVERRQDPSRDVVTTKSSPLRKHRQAYHGLARPHQSTPNGPAVPGIARLDTLTFIVTVEIVLGNQTFSVILDTGSSDTWVTRDGFVCVDENDVEVDSSVCGFERAFRGDFSQGEVPDQHFLVEYGGGQKVLGRLGFESLALGGITIDSQEIALVERGFFGAIAGVDGLLGLAFPLLTSAIAGGIEDASLLDVDQDQDPLPYDPVFTTMVKKNLVAPVFSVALDRDESADDGLIAFGGIPQVATQGAVARAPIQILDLLGDSPELLSGRSFYTIIPDAFLHGPAGGALTRRDWHSETPMNALIQRETNPTHNPRQQQGTPVIVDTGVALTLLPEDVANALFADFDPPAFLSDSGTFFAACNASVPQFGVQVGGTVLTVDARDLLRTDQQDESGENCLVGIQGSPGPFVLGDTFLNNVLAVFDVGAGEMRFAQRAEY